ncbi:MAG TPA: tRNA (adenine-N1)-methyltransferase, partial [Anaerolineales bacterium]|nr:tRNA (adenine-N1)-methyltransferase [Anaerolineales bacterium]
RFIFSLEPGNTFQSHLGIIRHDDMIGVPWGSRVQTHLGKVFAILQPQLDDLLRDIPRQTQIMYPKDIGYILVTMGIGPGYRVLEAGTGSGAFTTALAYMVGDEGHVTTYEKRKNFSEAAQKTLASYRLDHRVSFKHGDIGEGVDEVNLHAVFLDLPEPEKYIAIVRDTLIPGGYLGCFLPTTNQVSTLITTLKQNNFDYIEVSEMLHRYYKPTATRLRPVDQMVAHTGFMIFTRKLASFSEMAVPKTDTAKTDSAPSGGSDAPTK